MKKVFVSVVACLTLIAVSISISAAQELKVATLSIQDVIDNSKVGKEARKVLEAKKSELQPKFEAEQKVLQDQAAEIEKKSSVWSEEVRAEKERDYQKNMREYQLRVEDASYEMKQLEKKVLDPIFKELQTVISDVGEKEGLSIIFEKARSNGLLFADKSLDMSDVIVKELDKRMAK